MPGEVGNFAAAGHRVGIGAPFHDVAARQGCDAIVVETAAEWVTCRVLAMGGQQLQELDCFRTEQHHTLPGECAQAYGRHITVPGDIGVSEPLPSLSDASATEAILTRITWLL